MTDSHGGKLFVNTLSYEKSIISKTYQIDVCMYVCVYLGLKNLRAHAHTRHSS